MHASTCFVAYRAREYTITQCVRLVLTLRPGLYSFYVAYPALVTRPVTRVLSRFRPRRCLGLGYPALCAYAPDAYCKAYKAPISRFRL